MPKTLDNAHPTQPGKSILEQLWDEMDAHTSRLLSDYAENEFTAEALRAKNSAILEYGEARGYAQGMAYALAVLMNPYAPNVDAIREQVMDRMEDRPRKPVKDWTKGNVAYHHGRRVTVISVGTQFAYVKAPSSAKFNVPLHELSEEMEDADTE